MYKELFSRTTARSNSHTTTGPTVHRGSNRLENDDDNILDPDGAHVPLMADFNHREAASVSGASSTADPSFSPQTGSTSLSGEDSETPLPLAHHDGARHHRPDARGPEEGEDSGTTTPPRFLQDQSGRWRRWRRCAWMPYPVRHVARKVVRWVGGPDPPRRYYIKPLFPAVQEYPLRLADRLVPGQRGRNVAAFVFFALWLVVFSIVKNQERSVAEIEGWGVPASIGCGATYWSYNNHCGVDGNDCRPFTGSGLPFRCPANCESYHVLNPRAVGTREVIYRPMVIGGPPDDGNVTGAFYRGDSYVCGSAIHAGVVSNAGGGCGIVQLIGTQAGFAGSSRHGISSVGFDSYFPLSFRFLDGVECSAVDSRWVLLGISVGFTTFLALFTASPALFFFPAFTMVFWTVGLATDPPGHASTADLVSTVLGRYLPAMFCAWVVYGRMGVRRTLQGLTAQVEKTVLWLGACWVTALDNYTIGNAIPIQRLNAHDLQQQPGAKAALVIIIIVLVVIVVSQIWFFRQEGRLPDRLRLYGLILFGILVSLGLPDLSLRLHHYVIALLLLPGTGLQTRPSLLFQGLLVGWFINGIARWGFDAVLQTADVLRGDAQFDSALPAVLRPVIAAAAGNATQAITFSWERAPSSGVYDGISVLINDVERFRGYFSDGVANFTWMRDAGLGLDEYFRFGFMRGSYSQDYTKAGTWTRDGGWVHMQEGPSKARRSMEAIEMLHG